MHIFRCGLTPVIWEQVTCQDDFEIPGKAAFKTLKAKQAVV